MNENILELMDRIKQAAAMTEVIVALQVNDKSRLIELAEENEQLKKEIAGLKAILNREALHTYRAIQEILG